VFILINGLAGHAKIDLLEKRMILFYTKTLVGLDYSYKQDMLRQVR
jgi:hypothetical protein